MTLTIDEFVEFSHPQQLDMLYEHGVYIGKRYRKGMIVMLFQLDSFYVEVFYTEYRRHVHHIRSFTSAAGIDSYLETIDIENLSF